MNDKQFYMKKIFLFLLVAGAIGAAIGYRMWNKPHQDMNAAKAEIAIDAAALFAEFDANEDAANAKYLSKGAGGADKVIALTGTVKNVATEGSTVVYIEAGGENEISAELNASVNPAPRTDFKTGEKVNLKCTCTGKNMFTLEMKNCVEIK